MQLRCSARTRNNPALAQEVVLGHRSFLSSPRTECPKAAEPSEVLEESWLQNWA